MLEGVVIRNTNDKKFGLDQNERFCRRQIQCYLMRMSVSDSKVNIVGKGENAGYVCAG